MKKVVCPIALFAILVITACENNGNDAMSARVDSLQNRLAAIGEKMAEVDTAAIRDKLNAGGDALKYFQLNNKDTIDKKTAIFLSDYNVVRKSLARLNKQRMNIIEDLAFSGNQLNDLKTDVSNQILDQDQFDNYCRSEKSALSRTEETVDNLLSWYHSTMDRYDELHPGMLHFVDSMKQVVAERVDGE